MTPRVNTRVDVHLFAGDLLAQRPPVVFESYAGDLDDRGGLRLEDGHGVKVVVSGERTSLRMLLAGALAQLDPATALERHDEPEVTDE